MPIMKICPKCGKANDQAFVRCVHCGTSLDKVAAVNVASASVNAPAGAAAPHAASSGDVKICPKCGKSNAPKFVYCGECGTFLGGAAVANAASTSANVSVGSSESRVTSNGVAGAIKAIAVLVYIGGFFLGLSLSDVFSTGGLLIGVIIGFCSGTMLLGFAEIIRLLHEINQKK